MQILKKIDKLNSKQAFYSGIMVGISIFCFAGLIILLNIKYENPFNGLTTPILGIMTAYIAYQQYRISRHQLKLDLYNKRFEVFECIRDLLIEIQTEAQSKDKNKYYDFIIKADNSKFLFDQDIISYTEDIRQKISRLKYINIRLNDQRLCISEESESLANENTDILEWFNNELYGGIHNKFAKYINVNTIA